MRACDTCGKESISTVELRGRVMCEQCLMVSTLETLDPLVEVIDEGDVQ